MQHHTFSIPNRDRTGGELNRLVIALMASPGAHSEHDPKDSESVLIHAPDADAAKAFIAAMDKAKIGFRTVHEPKPKAEPKAE